MDEKGRKRASIFYKATFYDRDAFFHVNRRYGVRYDYDREEKKRVGISHVMDGDRVIYTTEPIKAKGEKYFDLLNRANALAVEWLNLEFPDWEDPSAYWD